MDAEFANHRDVRGHFGGVVGWDGDRFAADEDVKGARIEDDPAGVSAHLFPEIFRVVVGQFGEVDDACVGFRAVADEGVAIGFQVDGKAKAAGNRGVAGDNGRHGVEGAQGIVGDYGLAPAEDNLVQHLAGGGDDGEALRANLDVKRAGVAVRDAVKLVAAVGDDTGQKVKAADGGFGAGGCGGASRQREAFKERNHVDAPFFENGAVSEVHFVHCEIAQAVGDGAILPGKERGADAVGAGSEAQVERCRLDLARRDRLGRGNRAGLDHRGDFGVGENALCHRGPGRENARRRGAGVREVVGLAGLEPATFRPPDGRATRLRHSPTGEVLTQKRGGCKGGSAGPMGVSRASVSFERRARL